MTLMPNTEYATTAALRPEHVTRTLAAARALKSRIAEGSETCLCGARATRVRSGENETVIAACDACAERQQVDRQIARQREMRAAMRPRRS